MNASSSGVKFCGVATALIVYGIETHFRSFIKDNQCHCVATALTVYGIENGSDLVLHLSDTVATVLTVNGI